MKLNEYLKIIICVTLLFVGLHLLSNPFAKPIKAIEVVSPKTEQAEVVRVIDGDTIDVSIRSKLERVRLLGINTPEIVDPRKPVECFGKEAKEELEKLLQNKEVLLVSDSSQADRDTYGRLLRYVYTDSGTLLNRVLLSEGYAYEYTYDVPYKFQPDFKSAERSARISKLGLWADGACVTIPK